MSTGSASKGQPPNSKQQKIDNTKRALAKDPNVVRKHGAPTIASAPVASAPVVSPEVAALKNEFAVFDKAYQACKPKCYATLQPVMLLWWTQLKKSVDEQDTEARVTISAFTSLLKPCLDASLKVKTVQQVAERVKANIADPDKTTLINESKTAVGLLQEVKTLKDASTKLATCQTAMDTSLLNMRAKLKERAAALEAGDGGHSIGRHGPDVTELQLDTRVKTGVAADGAQSPTHTSTKFDEIEYWLETREKAMAKLSRLNGGLGAPRRGAQEKHTIIIEHNKPIDIGFIADESSAKELPMMDGANVRYEKKKGKRLYKRNARSVPVDAQGNPLACDRSQPPLPLDSRGRPIDSDDFEKVRAWKGKPPVLKIMTYTVYTKSVKVSGLTRTLTTVEWDGTEWKVVQQFPHAEGWDDEKKKYTTKL